MAILKMIRAEAKEDSQGNIVRKYHDNNARSDLIDYLTNPRKCVEIGGCGLYPPNAAYEMDLVAHSWGKDKGLRAYHWILSFSGEECERFGSSLINHMIAFAEFICNYIFSNGYQVFYAIHSQHSDHTHIHFVMNSVNFITGKKFEGKKRDLYLFQKILGDHLKNCYGIQLMVVSSDEELERY